MTHHAKLAPMEPPAILVRPDYSLNQENAYQSNLLTFFNLCISCGDGYFGNTVSKECVNCDASCATCDANGCLTCPAL